MIHEDMTDIFRQMDAMMAQLMREMESGFPAGMMPGAGGYRIIIHGGELPPGIGGPEESRSRDPGEPAAEVHRIGDEVKVVTELPGVTDEALRLNVSEGRLVIDAGDADRHYHTSAALPPVDPASMKKSLRNGVLEVTFTALPEQPENDELPEK
ncbi:MAG: hypothetical protein A4E35_00911 [Methanoregula sp. PtaU1.Bin051]|nr:MAG: hypothetical protein A4E35_00911 [Methanoregula sp. PtaU1.Bin051]